MRRLLIASFTCAALAATFAPGARADEPAPAAPGADSAARTKWAEHTGDLPFVFGYAEGMKDVEVTGRPPLLFFTATW